MYQLSAIREIVSQVSVRYNLTIRARLARRAYPQRIGEMPYDREADPFGSVRLYQTTTHSRCRVVPMLIADASYSGRAVRLFSGTWVLALR